MLPFSGPISSFYPFVLMFTFKFAFKAIHMAIFCCRVWQFWFLCYVTVCQKAGGRTVHGGGGSL